MSDKATIKNFYDLKAWQAAKDLCVDVYKATELFPKSELFGLSNQLRRASVSIASNIAEGFPRSTRKDKLHFLRISKGSVAEVQSQFLIAKELKFISEDSCRLLYQQSVVVDKLITGMSKALGSGKGVKNE